MKRNHLVLRVSSCLGLEEADASSESCIPHDGFEGMLAEAVWFTESGV